MDEVDLPAATQLTQDCLADQLVVEAGDVGADCQPVDRGGFDNRQITHPGQAHVQGTRDRRGCQSEDIDLGAQLLQFLFVADTEALLLIDNHQPQVVETHIALQ